MVVVRRSLSGCFCAVLLLLAGGALARADEAASASEVDYELMKMFVDTFQQIDRNYVKDVDRRQLVEAAVKGMLDKLDPYSDYISPEDLAKFNEAVEQEFGGVGIQVHFDEEQRNILVMAPLPGGPAAEAGVKAGDRIVAIEDQPVRDFPDRMEIQQAINLLKGEPGKQVKVLIKRAESAGEEQLTLTRKIIKLDTVLGDSRNPDGTWKFMLDDEKEIAYVRLTNFATRSGDELKGVLEKLQEDGMRGLILDLRTNPGGKLESAVEVSDLFLESGLIVRTEGRNSAPHPFAAKRFGTFSGFPMVVLVNRYSASASEIVAAALQDHKRAIVIGERTWGKGSVQTVIDMKVGEDRAALKLTTAAYFRPSGKNIHRFPDAKETDEWGVTPDEGYVVTFTDHQMGQYQRLRQQRDAIAPPEPIVADFVDSQLAKARETIEQQLLAPAAEEAPSEAPTTPPAPAPEPEASPAAPATPPANPQ